MRLILSLKDENGRVIVAGFRDDVRPVSVRETDAIDRMPAVEEVLKKELGISTVEGGGVRLEALMMEPAIVVRGFYGGGIGAKARNIIEPSAEASLNVRLVPDLTPARVVDHLKRHFEKQGMHVIDTLPSAGMDRVKTLTLRSSGGYRAFRTPLDEPAVARLLSILNQIDETPTLVTPTLGGSLPIYLFEDTLDMPIVILPIANHDNNQHGRNENIRLANLFDAVTTYAVILGGWPM